MSEMKYYIQYNPQTLEGKSVCIASSGVVMEQNNELANSEISQEQYNQIRQSKRQTYIKNNEIFIKPEMPTPYHDWDIVNKVWVLNEQKQIEMMTFEGRENRNQLLTEMDQVVSNPLRWSSFTEEKRQEWMEYRQALLDVPQQSGFPLNIAWPKKPE